MNKKILSLFICFFFIFSFLLPIKRNICFAKKAECHNIECLLETELAHHSNKAGDVFKAKLPEDLKINDKVLIPKGSIIAGRILKISDPGRFFRHGYMELSIDHVELPSKKVIAFTGDASKMTLMPPNAKGIRQTVIARAPVSAASTATSIMISQLTALEGPIAYVISMCAGIATGGFGGFLYPHKSKSRINSSICSAYQSSPIGTFNTVISSGHTVQFKTGDSIVIDMDQSLIDQIQNYKE